MQGVVGYACVAVALVRLIYVWQPLRSDEGGYLFAARHWRVGGEFLYGDFHVDRPPLLMAIFRVAALSDWDRAIRVLSIPFALVAVVAVARAGYLLAGERGARWSAVVAAALMSSPALAADQADGELFAVPLVAASIALTLGAWRRPAGVARFRLAFAAGALAGAAPLVKQSFLEGLLFVGVLLIAESVRCRRVTPRCRELAAGAALGTLLPTLLVVVWARSAGVDALRLWTELASFRGDAFAVIWQGSTRAPVRRGVLLVVLAVVSAMLPVAWTWVRACRERGSQRPAEEMAISGGLLFGVAALVAGGSYWPHYLLQSVPILALAAGMVAARESPVGAKMRRWSRIAAGSAVAAAVVTATVYAAVPSVWSHERTGEWLARSSEPGDTVFVAYGTPSILEAANLSTPYPYLWSLSMRTLDPRQDRLRATLAAPDAPTWLVEVNGWNLWHIDRSGRLRSLIESRYDLVATVCGYKMWLRSDLPHELTPSPSC